MKKGKKYEKEGVLIPAGALIGLGIGMFYNQAGVGVISGLGVGFLAFYLATLKKK